jgi:hypothetical protein
MLALAFCCMSPQHNQLSRLRCQQLVLCLKLLLLLLQLLPKPPPLLTLLPLHLMFKPLLLCRSLRAQPLTVLQC